MRWISAGGALTAVAWTVAAWTGMASPTAGAGAQAAPPPVVPPAIPVPVQPRFVVVLDAAHGGTDTGVRLADGTAEKNITLALSVHLRSVLHARGIDVVTTRESD